MTTSPPAAARVVHPDGGGLELYMELLRAARSTQRCPVWCGEERRFGDVDVPDDPAAAVAAVAAVDAAETLARWWPGPCPDGCACLTPFTGDFPPLIRAGDPDRSTLPATLAEAVAFGRDADALATLGVVGAARPADLPAVLGWGGSVDRGERGDPVHLSAVLRSWEERFGATLVWIGSATLVLTVADPPTTTADAEHVAAEHFAFCPDQLDPQTGREPFTPASYGRMIRGVRRWRFWWD